MYFRFTNTAGNADKQFVVGQSTWIPVAGVFGVISSPPPPTTSTSTTTTTVPGSFTFGAGTWIVGAQVPPDTYRNVGFSNGCYWERLSGFGGTLDEIIANNFDDVRQIVEIKPTDVGFSTDSDCGTWSTDLTPLKTPTSALGPGTWQVGPEVAAGTWQNAPATGGCYWERRSGFGGQLTDIIANDFVPDPVPSVVTVQPSDTGFYTDADCGTWTYLGP